MPSDRIIEWIAGRPEPERPPGGGGTLARTVDLFRVMLQEGAARPGDHLAEEDIAAALRVSRNTLREAFRLLAHEGLIVHQPHRGVFVRRLTAGDVADIYRVRRLVELDAVRKANAAPRAVLDHLGEVTAGAERAAAKGDWHAVATANIHWHQAVAQLTGSRRLQDTMAGVLAELRLAFDAFSTPADQAAFHRPYVPWNRRINDLIDAGDTEAAEGELATYLFQAERRLLAGYERPLPD